MLVGREPLVIYSRRHTVSVTLIRLVIRLDHGAVPWPRHALECVCDHSKSSEVQIDCRNADANALGTCKTGSLYGCRNLPNAIHHAIGLRIPP